MLWKTQDVNNGLMRDFVKGRFAGFGLFCGQKFGRFALRGAGGPV